MSHEPPLSRQAFDDLIREHQRLVHLANDLELQLYGLGEGEQAAPSREQVTACQQAAGRLIGQLRQTLFRLDQQIYPRLEPKLPSP